MHKILIVSLLSTIFMVVPQAWAKKLTPEQRIQRLERQVDSKGLVDMLIKLEELQKEVQILRGEIELQTHTLDNIKKQQRNLYVDIDRRILKLERTGSSASPTQSSAA